MLLRLALLVVWLAFPRLAHGQGGPPLLTDDPGTPGNGHWEINVAATTLHGSGAHESELPLLDLNYGVGERVQLKYEVAYLVRDEEGEQTRRGVGNSLAGVKWRFYDAGDAGWRVSTYPQIEFRTPGSDAVRDGLTEEGTNVLLPAEFQRDFSRVSLNVEAGWEWRSEATDAWFGGVAVGHEFPTGFELAAELHGEFLSQLDRCELAFNAGARVAVSESSTLLLSVGRELRNDFESRTGYFGYLGWQMRR